MPRALAQDPLQPGAGGGVAGGADVDAAAPPGSGSRLVRITEATPIYERLGRDIDGVRLLATGPAFASGIWADERRMLTPHHRDVSGG